MRGFFLQNAQVLIASLGRLYRAPLSTLLTASVIGISLALPAGLMVMLENLQKLSAGWDDSATISVFLQATVEDAAAERLAEEFLAWPEVREVRTITRAAALAEFRTLSGLGEILDALDENPLPAVLVVTPEDAHAHAEAARALAEKLRLRPQVDMTQLDLQWVQRFAALMEIGKRGVLIIGALLGLAVLLIVGNTIRLDIQNRKAEIVVTKLIGGTDAFIRRPFLYTGLWYGLLGALLAWILVEVSFLLVKSPAEQLAGLYESSFSLHTLDLAQVFNLLIIGIILGLAGSWLAVGRHLNSIEPR